MKRAPLYAALLLSTAPLRAGDSTLFEDTLRPVSARLTALGGAGAPLGDDLAAARANPAGLARLWRREAAASQETLFGEQTTTALGYAHPTDRAGAYAAALRHTDFGDFQGYDASANRTASLSAGEWEASLAHGRPFGPAWSAGAALRAARQTLNGESASMTVLDGGVFYQALPRPSFPAWRAGAALRGLGRAKGHRGAAASPPREAVLGLSLRPLFDALVLSVEGTQPSAGDFFWRAGAEYRAREVVSLRAGWDGRADAGRGFAVGAGVNFWEAQLDYAFQPYGDLGDRHQITLSYRFGSLAETYYERGMDYLRRGDYPRAILQFSQVIRLNPSHRRALLRLRETNDRLQKNQRSLQWR